MPAESSEVGDPVPRRRHGARYPACWPATAPADRQWQRHPPRRPARRIHRQHLQGFRSGIAWGSGENQNTIRWMPRASDRRGNPFTGQLYEGLHSCVRSPPSHDQPARFPSAWAGTGQLPADGLRWQPDGRRPHRQRRRQCRSTATSRQRRRKPKPRTPGRLLRIPPADSPAAAETNSGNPAGSAPATIAASRKSFEGPEPAGRHYQSSSAAPLAVSPGGRSGRSVLHRPPGKLTPAAETCFPGQRLCPDVAWRVQPIAAASAARPWACWIRLPACSRHWPTASPARPHDDIARLYGNWVCGRCGRRAIVAVNTRSWPAGAGTLGDQGTPTSWWPASIAYLSTAPPAVTAAGC